MPRKFTFSTKESNGREYVIAQPRTEAGEPVRLEADWVEGDEVEGKWERAVRAIIKEDLMGGMELEEGDGRLSRRRAIEVLATAEDEEGPITTSEAQAEALVEYFAEQDVLDVADGDVVLLQNPKDNELSAEKMLNWAAGIDACVEKITETIGRVESAKEKLQDHLDKLDTNAGGIDERLQETAQELKSLGPGPSAPEDPSKLSGEERSRYDQLKRELIYHRQMQEVDRKNLVQKVEAGANELAQNIRMLESAKEALTSKRKEVRTMAMKEGIFPEDAINIVENMGNLATQLAQVDDVDEQVENTTPDEVADLVSEVTGEVQEATETVQETAGEEDREPATDYQL